MMYVVYMYMKYFRLISHVISAVQSTVRKGKEWNDREGVFGIHHEFHKTNHNFFIRVLKFHVSSQVSFFPRTRESRYC